MESPLDFSTFFPEEKKSLTCGKEKFPFLTLYSDLIKYIVTMLGYDDTISLCQTCKRLNSLLSLKDFWLEKAKYHFKIISFDLYGGYMYDDAKYLAARLDHLKAQYKPISSKKPSLFVTPTQTEISHFQDRITELNELNELIERLTKERDRKIIELNSLLNFSEQTSTDEIPERRIVMLEKLIKKMGDPKSRYKISFTPTYLKLTLSETEISLIVETFKTANRRKIIAPKTILDLLRRGNTILSRNSLFSISEAGWLFLTIEENARKYLEISMNGSLLPSGLRNLMKTEKLKYRDLQILYQLPEGLEIMTSSSEASESSLAKPIISEEKMYSIKENKFVISKGFAIGVRVKRGNGYLLRPLSSQERIEVVKLGYKLREDEESWKEKYIQKHKPYEQ